MNSVIAIFRTPAVRGALPQTLATGLQTMGINGGCSTPTSDTRGYAVAHFASEFLRRRDHVAARMRQNRIRNQRSAASNAQLSRRCSPGNSGIGRFGPNTRQIPTGEPGRSTERQAAEPRPTARQINGRYTGRSTAYKSADPRQPRTISVCDKPLTTCLAALRTWSPRLSMTLESSSSTVHVRQARARSRRDAWATARTR